MKFKILISLSIVFCLGLNAQTPPSILNDRGFHTTNKYYVDGNIVNPSNITYERLLEDEPVGINSTCFIKEDTIVSDSIYIKPEKIKPDYRRCIIPPSQITLKAVPNQYGQYINSEVKNAENFVTIKGNVLDAETTETVPLVNVILRQNGVIIRGVSADFDGNFELTAPDFGEYVLEVFYVGYTPQRIELDLNKNLDDFVVELDNSPTSCRVIISECYAPYTIAQQIEQQSIDESLFEDESQSARKLVYGNIKHNISIHKLPYVFLVLKETGQKTRVDYSGMYRFEDVEQGNYTVQVFLEGQLLKEIKLSVSEQEKTQLSFSL